MKLTPFKRWTLENFPFIEDDFDAITSYQLYCKIVEYLNKTIDSQNEVIKEVNEMKEYLDNLDIQDAVDHKLDEMAESGQLTDIIAQYLDLAGVLAYDTVDDMKDATNLTNGSICRTLGYETYNDKEGAFYKIRNILNTDVIDNINIIAITNDNTLIAEKIGNKFALADDTLPKSYGKADHLGIGNETYTSKSSWTSTVASVRANRTSTQSEQLISAPSVFSPANSEEASLYTGRDSVALFIANQGKNPVLSVEDNPEIEYTETSVTYPEDADISNVKVGMIIDTLHDNQLSAIISSIDTENHVFNIEEGWYYNGVKNTNPTDGKGYKIGKIVKIWGKNTVVSLYPQFEQRLATGEEMGLNNMLDNDVSKQIVGYDVVTLGTGKGDIGFLARTGGAVFDSPGEIGKLEHGFMARGVTEALTVETDTDNNFILVSKNANGQLTKNRFYLTAEGVMANPKLVTANISANGQIPNPECRIWYFIPSSNISYTLPDLTSSTYSYYNKRIYTFLNRSAYTVTLSNGYTLNAYSSVTYYAENVWLRIASV